MRLRFLPLALLAAIGAAADTAPEPIDLGGGKPTEAKPAEDAGIDPELAGKASYLIGWQIGQMVKEQGLKQDKIAEGIADVVAGKPLAMSMQEAQQVMMEFQQKAQAAQQAKQAAVMAKANEGSAKRKETNPQWLAENGKKPGVTTTKSGLQYSVVSSGDAKGKTPTRDDSVSVNYTGKLLDGTVFDSSERNGGPVSFGVGQVIPGWTEALQLMHPGDKWTLYIPSELAYGENAPPQIGPNQILVFDVELVKIAAADKPATP